MKYRFFKFKLYGRFVVVYDVVILEEIMNISDVLDLFKDVEDFSSVIDIKEKNVLKKLKVFIDRYCRVW